MSDATPTVPEIVKALNANGVRAKESRDGKSAIVGFGNAGFLRLYPDTLGINDERSAARIEGKVPGAKHRAVRDALEAAGIGSR
jgi:hypothetical protein